MASKSMAYDNPAYQAVDGAPLGVVGPTSATTSTKFAAFTAKYIKSITIKPTTAAGASDVISLIQISGTSTTTTALTTFGSGVTTYTNVQPASGTQSLGNAVAQGDTYYVVKGTDTSGIYIGEVESVIQPLASVTQ